MTPELIRGWTAPFHSTADGIKDANGCWICSASNGRLAEQLVELMNFAARFAEAETSAAIERFDSSAIMWSLDGAPLTPSKDGQWVRHADYAVASATAERLLGIAYFADLMAVGLRPGDRLKTCIGTDLQKLDAARRLRNAGVASLEDSPNGPLVGWIGIAGVAAKEDA